MSMRFRSWKNMGTFPRVECSHETSGCCIGGSCPNKGACGGWNNVHREALFYRAAERLAAQMDEEDILILCLDHGLAREQVIRLMEAGISLEAIERVPDVTIQIALEG